MKISTRKAKGASFEYDCLESLQAIYPNMYLTSKQGFVQQYDLRDDNNKIVVECKRHKGFSWNELIKLFKKLKSKSPENYKHFLIIKANRQPCLIMNEDEYGLIFIQTFEDYFKTPFIKHTPINR